MFLIDDYFEGGIDDLGNECKGYVASRSKYKLNFTKRETNDLMFWDYYSNENTSECCWSSGVFRYFTNEQAAQILKKTSIVKIGTSEEQLAREFLEHYCKIHSINIAAIQNPSGSRLVNCGSN